MDTNEKLKKIAENVNKDYGEEGEKVCFVPGIEDSTSMIKDWISTGSYTLDWMLGGEKSIKGIPTGRLTEIYGDFSTGKTALGHSILAECQKKGGVSVLFDTEERFDLEFARKINLDPKGMLLLDPDTIEDVFELTEKIISQVENNMLLTIVWDSLAATSSRAEMKEEAYGTPEMAIRARIISQAFRKITKLISKRNVALVIINQIRENIGVLFGAKSESPGGKAVKFHSSIRLQLSKHGEIKNQRGDVTGVIVKCYLSKSSICSPFRSAEICLSFEKGFDPYFHFAESLEKSGKIEMSSPGWFSYKGKRFRSSQIEEILKDNSEILALEVKK